ncbi:HAD family hydrolase [Mucilaginibacter aquariorum]|uniref:phosphoglycolate phosphatase n=1 Tax=Mucilaginibacter aquariorum TaxID=2967225 RepID=A0ABT1T2A8_9SPHI|nr:HAD hydrolase-like protein [Mucilaginibacter aquariorum]MCQ6958603.1 HAD hydrolase-like protein [Mucilaginibacter aquariorum]
MMKDINFIITDLDDTLWDWLAMWHNSFEPYLNRIADETGIDQQQLIIGFKELHQKYGTTEMSFAYKELPIIEPRFYPLFDTDKGEVKSILHEYYSNKKNNLRLYDLVVETLKEIKSKGVKIVAFTESYVFFTKYRFKHLNLDGIIDAVYSPRGSELPLSVYRHYQEDFWEPKITEFKVLPNETRKPNPEILDQIIADFKAKKQNSIYVGDKLDRDIYMAQKAGITSVYASYGHVIDNAQYDLLRNVTHWTDEDVKREMDFKSQPKDIKQPDYTIQRFSDLLKIFNYVKFS